MPVEKVCLKGFWIYQMQGLNSDRLLKRFSNTRKYKHKPSVVPPAVHESDSLSVNIDDLDNPRADGFPAKEETDSFDVEKE